MSQFDVVIVGGAMTGATLAIALDSLSNHALSIAIIERSALNATQHPGFDARSIALSYGSVQLLKKLNLWDEIAKHAEAIQQIHVSDRSHFSMTKIDHRDHELEALGYVVELFNVGQSYQRELAQRSQITLFTPASVSSIVRSAQNVALTLDSGEQLSGRLLVAADGAMSAVCQQLEIHQRQHDTGQVAIIANIQCDKPHLGQAFERFSPEGPIALLPMQHNRLSLVWCVSYQRAQGLLTLSDEAFLAQLQRAFGWRLGRFIAASGRDSYPLIIRQREQTISHRVAVVGNAAQALHPIAGQGFNLALRDVMSLAEEVVLQADDVGDFTHLHRFQQRRQHDKEKTITLTTSLVSLFSNEWPALTVGRNLGLFTVDQFSFFKAPLLRQTLGIVER